MNIQATFSMAYVLKHAAIVTSCLQWRPDLHKISFIQLLELEALRQQSDYWR